MENSEETLSIFCFDILVVETVALDFYLVYGLEIEIAERPSLEFEAHNNLIGLFSILLEVGRRVNPEKYGGLIADKEQTENLPQNEAIPKKRRLKYNDKKLSTNRHTKS